MTTVIWPEGSIFAGSVRSHPVCSSTGVLSRPHGFNMGWVVRVTHYAACKECGIHIPLHNSRSITQYMPPLTERFFGTYLGCVVVLRQLQRPGMQINPLAAGTPALRRNGSTNSPGALTFTLLP